MTEVPKSKEKVMIQLSGIFYQEKEYNCTITDVKTFLSGVEAESTIEIDHNNIDHISLEKSWYADLIPIILISTSLSVICLILGLITYFPLSFTPANIPLLRAFIYPAILFLAIDFCAIFLYFTQARFTSVLINSKTQFQLFSNYKTILTLLRTIRNTKVGQGEFNSKENPLEFTPHQMLISKILIAISTFFFILVSWFSHIFGDLLYIPFLFLVIGFFVALLAYNEKKVNPLWFKLGYLFMFAGLVTVAILLYINLLPIPGLVLILLGALLFFYC